MIDDAIATLAVENVDRNAEIVRRNYKVLSDWVEGEPLVDWVPP